MTSSTPNKLTFFLDPFAYRQFDLGSRTADTKITDISKEDFTQKVNEIFEKGNLELKEGYAPFCKHVFVENFTEMLESIVEINEDNKALLESDYVARNEHELPVLSRWFPKEKFPAEKRKKAKYLDVILYTREQLISETQAMGKSIEFYEKEVSNIPWGIVSVKPQGVDYEIPMQPITMLRNALGKEQGGSGVALDKQKYMDSVKFWAKHAMIS